MPEWKRKGKADLHIVTDHAAESDFALLADFVGGKGYIVAYTTDGLGDVGGIGYVGQRRHCFVAFGIDTAGIVTAQIKGDRASNKDVSRIGLCKVGGLSGQ